MSTMPNSPTVEVAMAFIRSHGIDPTPHVAALNALFSTKVNHDCNQIEHLTIMGCELIGQSAILKSDPELPRQEVTFAPPMLQGGIANAHDLCDWMGVDHE